MRKTPSVWKWPSPWSESKNLVEISMRRILGHVEGLAGPVRGLCSVAGGGVGAEVVFPNIGKLVPGNCWLVVILVVCFVLFFIVPQFLAL